MTNGDPGPPPTTTEWAEALRAKLSRPEEPSACPWCGAELLLHDVAGRGDAVSRFIFCPGCGRFESALLRGEPAKYLHLEAARPVIGPILDWRESP